MNKITFSHNGWISLISEGYTFDNLKILTQDICNYLRREQNYIDNFPPRIAIGFDNRFLGHRYSEEVSKIVIENGFDAYLSDRPSPTPALMFAAKTLVLTGGIILTAGDMSFEYNGVKISTPQGALMSEQATKEIESEIAKLAEVGLPEFPITPGEIIDFNPKHYYFHHLAGIVNLAKIGKTGIDITVDSLNGSASNYIKEVLFNHDCMIRELNNNHSYDFGGLIPNLNKKNLVNLQQTVLAPRTNLQVGFAIDGDGSKLRAVDISGSIVADEAVFCIILKHLVENKNIKRGIVKPANEGKLIEKLAKSYGLTIYETKNKDSRNVSELMRTNDCMIGGTLDGDYHINLNHILEKDAILACLLILEAMSYSKHNLNFMYNKICEDLTV